jgi:hypothetical protein
MHVRDTYQKILSGYRQRAPEPSKYPSKFGRRLPDNDGAEREPHPTQSTLSNEAIRQGETMREWNNDFPNEFQWEF